MIEGQNPVHDGPATRGSFDIESGTAPELGDHRAEPAAIPPLMDSRQPPSIRVHVFVWQFVFHMLPYPVNLLVYPPAYRKYGLRNQLVSPSWRDLRAMGLRAALQWFDYERLRGVLLWTNVALFAARRAEFERCDVSPSEILAIL